MRSSLRQLALLIALPSAMSVSQPKRSTSAKPPSSIKGMDAGVLPPAAVGPLGPTTSAPAKEDVVPQARAQTRYFEGMGRTQAEQRQLEEISRALETYE